MLLLDLPVLMVGEWSKMLLLDLPVLMVGEWSFALITRDKVLRTHH
jgi:hypothetical protein